MIRTLQSYDEILAARAELGRRGLDFTTVRRLRLWDAIYRVRFRATRPPTDVSKSWDVLRAVEIIESAMPDHGAPVLDMGCYNSEVLWVLDALGYRDLFGCDLNPLCRLMPFWHRIRYRVADLTRTPFPDTYFAAITCLSVVEHGVNPDALVAEVRRLLRAGGVFVLTTDYDATAGGHAIAAGFRVFGQPWTIFDRNALQALCSRFLEAGFTWLHPGDLRLEHALRPIRWNREDYTFALAAFRAA